MPAAERTAPPPAAAAAPPPAAAAAPPPAAATAPPRAAATAPPPAAATAGAAERTISAPADVAAVLADPAYLVPPVAPAGPFGTLDWLRATVSRFASGATHERRRALIEARLRALDPDRLRALAAATPGDARHVPVRVLASETGVAPERVDAVVGAVIAVAAAYLPGSPAGGADAAVAELVTLLPPAEPEVLAQHIAILVQACAATAALIDAALRDPAPLDEVLRREPPAPATRRLAPDGTPVKLNLAHHPFGAGPRACPGAEHALALAEGALSR